MSVPTAGGTILVIEDDRALSVGLDLNLTAEGYRVTVAADGETGLAAALETKPDLVLLDLTLPGLDGLAVLAELRQRDREMPVIILSARAEEYDKVTGLGIGADDYMTKPFGLPELVARINVALRRKRRTDASDRWLRFADLVIDSQARRVTVAGREVELTARELDLLVYLARHPGRPHRREEILQAVWGYRYEGTVRTVDNFVRSLRAKLEADPASPQHLVTVHGVGYRFEP